MTSQLSYVDSLFLPLAKSPLRGAALGYTIDSFSESSRVVIDRTTPTRGSVDDEELFRDLFGSETEPRDASSGFGGSLSPHSAKKSRPLVPNKAIVWNSGATLTSPFGPTAPAVKSPRQTQLQQHSLAPVTVSVATPSLSAPPPRQPATDLMTSRPPESADNAECWDNRGLSGVPEVDEDDDDDDDNDDDCPHHKSKPVHRGALPLSPGASFKKQSAGSIQHETLRFLEKLDLKTLLAQPRPDVKSFLPHGTAMAMAVTSSNQVTHAADGRVEEDDRSMRTWSTVPGATTAAAGSSRKLSARKEATNPLAVNSSRLAHMELTYGTTAVEPRKARKETLQRLANPISGHTSTLQALSPDQRKKREAELGDWVPPVASPPLRKLSEKKTRNLIERLSEAPSVYEAAVAASPLKSKRLVKGTKTLVPVVRPRSNQEEEAGVKAKPTKPSASRPQVSGRGMDGRKAMLKQKLAARSATDASASTPSSGLGATFLTQHEETEAKLATKSSKQFAPRPPPARRLNEADGSQIPKRPTIPPSVRSRALASLTTAGAATPTSRSRGLQRSSGVKNKPDDTSSKSKPPQKATQSITKTSASQSRTSTRQTPSKPPAPTPSRPKRAASTPSSSGATALLLGGLQSSDTTQKTPGKSSARAGVGQAASLATSVSKRKSLVSKEASAPVAPSQSPLKTSLPQIRKPAATAPRRSLAPATGRIHRMRDT